MKNIYAIPPPKPLAVLGVLIAIGMVTFSLTVMRDGDPLFQVLFITFALGISLYNLWAAYQPPAETDDDQESPTA